VEWGCGWSCRRLEAMGCVGKGGWLRLSLLWAGCHVAPPPSLPAWLCTSQTACIRAMPFLCRCRIPRPHTPQPIVQLCVGATALASRTLCTWLCLLPRSQAMRVWSAGPCSPWCAPCLTSPARVPDPMSHRPPPPHALSRQAEADEAATRRARHTLEDLVTVLCGGVHCPIWGPDVLRVVVTSRESALGGQGDENTVFGRGKHRRRVLLPFNKTQVGVSYLCQRGVAMVEFKGGGGR
jgi:hypothetical protein